MRATLTGRLSVFLVLCGVSALGHPCLLRVLLPDANDDMLLPCKHARFGATSAPSVTGPLVAANPPDACGSLTHLPTEILLVTRGKCSFYTKAVNAMRTGVAALIIANSKSEGELMTLIRAEKQEKKNHIEDENAIPVVSVSKETGELLAKLGTSAQVRIFFGEPVALHSAMHQRVAKGLDSLLRWAPEQAGKELGKALRLCDHGDKECIWLWCSSVVRPSLGAQAVGFLGKMLHDAMSGLSTTEEHHEMQWLAEVIIQVAEQLRLQSKIEHQDFWQSVQSMLHELASDVSHAAGNHFKERGQYLVAEEYLLKAISLSPENLEAQIALASLLRASHFGRVTESHAINTKALAIAKLKLNLPEYLSNAGAWYMVGELQYQHALTTKDADSMRASLDYHNKSVQLEASTENLVTFSRVLLLNSIAATGLSEAHRTESAIEALKTAQRLSPGDAMPYFFLAKELHKQAKYKRAFEQYSEGNRLRHEELLVDPKGNLRQTTQRRILWIEWSRLWIEDQPHEVTEEFVRFVRDAQQHKDEMLEPSRQIFIVGMARSGTSVLEQMLSMHPEIHAIGEDNGVGSAFRNLCYKTWAEFEQPKSPSYLGSEEFSEMWYNCGPANLKRLAKPGRLVRTRNMLLRHRQGFNQSASYILSKGISDWVHVGFLMLLFPDAKFIHTTRDFYDLGLGIFIQDFGR
jgi:tetratricopeptide (TPR) repeat protein